jgi:hypothetical protein
MTALELITNAMLEINASLPGETLQVPMMPRSD